LHTGEPVRHRVRSGALDDVALLPEIARRDPGIALHLPDLLRHRLPLRDELEDHSQRERILKDTLLSAQKVSEDVRATARKEAELIVKDAELLSERLITQAMDRVADLERSIQDLKIQRKSTRNKVQGTIDTVQQLLMLDAEEEANELPITAMFRAQKSS